MNKPFFHIVSIGFIISIFIVFGILFVRADNRNANLPNESQDIRPEIEYVDQNIDEVVPDPVPELQPQAKKKVLPLGIVPAIYPYLTWGLQSEKAPRDNKYLLYAVNESDRLWISLIGKVWTSSNVVKSANEAYDLEEKFRGYYESEFLDSNWGQFAYFDQFELSAISADGPTGSVWGYVTHDDKDIRVIILSYDEENGDVTFEVFVSDVSPLAEILPQ